MVAIEYKSADRETRNRIVTMLIHNGLIPKAIDLGTLNYEYESGELSFVNRRPVGDFQHDWQDLGGNLMFEIDPETNQWVGKPMSVRLAWQPWEFDVLQRGIEVMLERDGGAPALSEGAL
jgi:hypothetical protein